MAEVQCARCGTRGPGLEQPPMPGRYGEAILANTCAECWKAWQTEQTLVINHYRLRPHIPYDRQQLYRHMSEFLKLDVV
ncbi:MAG: Fe(2+)-trafficking protein [Chloroflexi bacterium]|nr:Fe(2+)-trafficking protein [Chloroflexota bacterium]